MLAPCTVTPLVSNSKSHGTQTAVLPGVQSLKSVKTRLACSFNNHITHTLENIPTYTTPHRSAATHASELHMLTCLHSYTNMLYMLYNMPFLHTYSGLIIVLIIIITIIIPVATCLSEQKCLAGLLAPLVFISCCPGQQPGLLADSVADRN